MSRLVVSEFMSLDAVAGAPYALGGFEHGLPTLPFWSDELARFKRDELDAAGSLLLGRVTYTRA